MFALVRSVLAAAALATLACRTPMPEVQEGHALCPPCACDGDLSCVDVAIDSETASAVVDGKIYWFCSEECRERFLADPSRFFPR